MYRKEVTLQDAVIAVQLVENSMLTSPLLGVESALHSTFPDNPGTNLASIQLQLQLE
jgi:hypothetical protein